MAILKGIGKIFIILICLYFATLMGIHDGNLIKKYGSDIMTTNVPEEYDEHNVNKEINY